MRAKIIFGLILMLFIVVFTLQNSVSVPVKFFAWKHEMPVALIIVISLAIGVILGLLYSFTRKKPEQTNTVDSPLT
ncbi:MAG: LapA family protein [Bacteroidales bacterium]|nr:LapA family protein [Bacteroidales bacterium]